MLRPLPAAPYSGCGENPVLARTFGDVHGLVGPIDGVFRRFVVAQFGHAGAEGDQQLLFPRQEEALGKGALQPDQGGNGAVEAGVGEEDDELLAAVAGNGILRAHVFADHFDEVLQGFVTGLVAVVVIDLLEVVHVEQAQAQAGSAASGQGVEAILRSTQQESWELPFVAQQDDWARALQTEIAKDPPYRWAHKSSGALETLKELRAAIYGPLPLPER